MALSSGNSARSYLVMSFGAPGIGDHIVCSSFVRNLARHYPDASIDFGAFSPAGLDLFRYNPYIRNVYYLDMQYVRISGKYSLVEKLRYFREYRDRDYDAVYILGSKFRHAAFAFLTGAPKRIGYQNDSRGFLLTKTALEPLHLHVVDRFLNLLAIDGIEVSDSWNELFLSNREEEAATFFLRRHRINIADTVMIIAPFSADLRRTWPLERFWKTARHFANQGKKIIVIGSEQEKMHMSRNPPPTHPNIISCLGSLSILETAALIKKSSCFVGNDSGLGHIAGAVGTNALILGYQVTRFWHPISPSAITIIKDTGCTSCNQNTCSKKVNDVFTCFHSITTEEVIETLTRIMSSHDLSGRHVSSNC